MTQEEKSLLLQDLCARLPYGVKIYTKDGKNDASFILKISDLNWIFEDNRIDEMYEYDGWKPYLRPMSSMTEEEKEELLNLLFDKEAKYFYIDEEGFIDGKTSDLMKEGFNYPAFCPINIELYTDFLLSHHFDYRGLIEKKLALEAPDGMYK